MRVQLRPSFVALLFAASALVGCGGNPQAESVSESSSHAAQAPVDPAAISDALAQLLPEDRSIAESQKFCAVATENPLGSMGTPLKIEVNGEPVFLCCAGCKGKALRNPDETLASVAKLKTQNSEAK